MRKAIVFVVVLLAPAANAEIAGRASVIDGDTIEIHGQHIRLHGVDAPKKGQPCYNAAGQPYRCGTIAGQMP